MRTACRVVLALLALLPAPAPARAQDGDGSGQGWTRSERETFRRTAVGARLLPLAWFRALDGEDGTPLPTGLAAWGFPEGEAAPSDPDGLPPGLIRERGEGGPFLGMTCAACHARTLRVAGRVQTIEGAGSDLDAAGFLRALRAAVAGTAADPSRFERFAGRLGTAEAERPALRAALEATGLPAVPAAGPGRFAVAGAAPVRNARLWGTWRFDRGFASGAVPNGGSGWVAGHAVQVLAVAGPGAAPSVPGLLTVAALVRRLEPPAWPADFPSVDAAAAERGRAVFAAQCAGCHAPRTDGTGTLALPMVAADAAGTDPTAAAGRVAPERWALASAALARFGRLPPVPPLPPAGGRPAYRAAPLAGIWTSAPFLHDGSVPSLRELLVAPGNRGAVLSGNREYDPALLGFAAGPGPGGAGHAWGTDLPDDAKAALLEYLKTM